MKTEVVSIAAATQKRKKQVVENKQVTKQKGAGVATKDEDEEELAPGEDKIMNIIFSSKL